MLLRDLMDAGVGTRDVEKFITNQAKLRLRKDEEQSYSKGILEGEIEIVEKSMAVKLADCEGDTGEKRIELRYLKERLRWMLRKHPAEYREVLQLHVRWRS